MKKICVMVVLAALFAMPGLAQQAGTATNSSYSPDISVITDLYAGFASKNGERAKDIALREVEFVISGSVDTYGSYFVATTIHNHPELSFGGEHGHSHEGEESASMTLEEGYFTYQEMPFNLQLKVGKFRNNAGKVNTLHPHALAWSDYPLVIQNYLGEEGLIGTGASLSWLAPIDTFTEFYYEAFKVDDDEAALNRGESDDFAQLSRGRIFLDLTGNSTFQFGVTSLLAPNTFEDDMADVLQNKWLNGVDMTYKWTSANDSFRSLELIFSGMELRAMIPHLDEHVEGEELEREHYRGYYAAANFRLGKDWALAGRYDAIDSHLMHDLREEMASFYGTWHQSEYTYWRLGAQRLQHTLENVAEEAEYRVTLQLNVTLGKHPAHRY